MILTSGLMAFAFHMEDSAASCKRRGFGIGYGDPVLQREVPKSLVFYLRSHIQSHRDFFRMVSLRHQGLDGRDLGVREFFIAIIVCRATIETDTTPTGVLGKITQIFFGALNTGNVTTNLMTANVKGGVGIHSADLLIDLKSGYFLKSDPSSSSKRSF